MIPRTAPQPKGKRPQRHQTFATNVELEGMLSRATPLFPIEAIREMPDESRRPAMPAPSPATMPARKPQTPTRTWCRARDRRGPGVMAKTSGAPRETAADRRGMVAPPLGVPGREPPSRAALIVLGFGGLALAAGAVYVFYQGRSAILGRDAAVATHRRM